MNNLSGGQLAASISVTQRIDMIQKGYSPMNPEDVKNYIENKPPTGCMLQISTEILEEGTTTNSFGEKHMNYESDYRQLAQHLENKKVLDIDSLEKAVSKTPEKIETKSFIRNSLSNYGNENNSNLTKNINEKLTHVLGKTKENLSQKTSPNLINLPKEKKTYITESIHAKNLGYKYGCNYLNAFITNIKGPTFQNRIKFIEELNTLILKENDIHPTVLEEYRKGIAIAENELYKKIKSK